MGYTVGLPSLKLSNVEGKCGKHCGNFAKVAREALQERLGLDIDINHDLTQYNYYEGFKSAAELQAYSNEWIAIRNAEIEENNALIKGVVNLANAKRAEEGKSKLKEKEALKIINAERKKRGLPLLEKQKKIRVDAVVMCATLIKPPQEFMAALTQEQQLQFCLDAVEKFKTIVGAKNVKSVVIHFDEIVPHAHIFWQPVTDDGRLCAKEKHNLHFLGTLNREMPQFLRAKGWSQIDDCHAYDVEEAQKLREEMGDTAYREYRRSQRTKQGRDSKQFKGDMDRAVADAQRRLHEAQTALEATAEVLSNVTVQAETEQKNLNALQRKIGDRQRLLDDIKEAIDEEGAKLIKKQSVPASPIKPFYSKPTPQITIPRDQYIQNNTSLDLSFRERKQREKELGAKYDKQLLQYHNELARWAQWESDYLEYKEKYELTATVQKVAAQQEKTQKEQNKIAMEQAERLAQLDRKENSLTEKERELFFITRALAKQASGKLTIAFETLCQNMRKGMMRNEDNNRGYDSQHKEHQRAPKKGYADLCY